MIPEPTPVAGWPNGEKPSVVMPSAVIVTTDRFAFATTSVRSADWSAVVPADVEVPTGGVVEAAGTSWPTANAVPPTARAADRTAAPTMVPTPARRPGPEDRAADAPRSGAAVAVAAGTGAGRTARSSAMAPRGGVVGPVEQRALRAS